MLEIKNVVQKLTMPIIIVILVFCLFKTCKNNNTNEKTIKVKVPKIEKEFIFQKPTHTTITKYIKNNNLDDIHELEINKLLEEQAKERLEFAKATDSMQQLLYEQATELKEFKSTFDDEFVTIDINGVVKGEVKSITPKYTIKAREIETVIKERSRVFALKAGIEYGNNLQFNNSIFKGNIEFENKKSNSFSYGYDTNKVHWLGGKFTIFEIKK